MTTETFTNEAQTGQQGQTIIINSADKKSNGHGVAGFVLALIAIILGWVEVLGWIIWLQGLIFSAIGIFRKPKGFAIAGLAISLIVLVLLVGLFGAVLGVDVLPM